MSAGELPAPWANPLLLGQERAEAILLRAWTGGRLPHAWLLRGPRGVGKATLAHRFARRLLAGPEHAAAAQDPGHAIFRMTAHGAHPDLKVLRLAADPKSGRARRDIPVEEVRAVDEALHATAARGRERVLIVDAIDDLNRSGANALLKLLEEPPAGTVLLLVCQRPGLVLPTILSRCAQLVLAPLDAAVLDAGLVRLAPAIAPERRQALAAVAQGSLGRALTLEAGGWIEAYGELLGRLRAARSSEAARLALPGQLAGVIDRQGFRGAVDLLGLLLRRLAGLAAGRVPAEELVPGEQDGLRDLAAGHGLDRWLALWEKLAALTTRVEALNLDPMVALLQLVQGVCGVDAEVELAIV